MSWPIPVAIHQRKDWWLDFVTLVTCHYLIVTLKKVQVQFRPWVRLSSVQCPVSNCVIFFFWCLVTIITSAIDLMSWIWAIAFRVSSSRQPLHAVWIITIVGDSEQAQLKYVGVLENNFDCPTFFSRTCQIRWPLRERAKRGHHQLDDNGSAPNFFLLWISVP